ncbi:hypothetical protein [Cryobacterium sp. CG_9.6]|uniref:hypothetical protein n=1 Tax=Cryobacterium sp. CG_9.6 TaxID=2760710 RepID=UPI0024740CE3|nr:hypothetical protein [Cryobacterium sp. CG_9.6]MDH6236120.1 hypothetical protein [Cryobacterium sp. CG_9.6]
MPPPRRRRDRVVDALRSLASPRRRPVSPLTAEGADASASAQSAAADPDGGPFDTVEHAPAAGDVLFSARVDRADPALSWIAHPNDAPEHWLRRIREAAVSPPVGTVRHRATEYPSVDGRTGSSSGLSAVGESVPQGQRPRAIDVPDVAGPDREATRDLGVPPPAVTNRFAERAPARLHLRLSSPPHPTPMPGVGTAADDLFASRVAPNRIVLRPASVSAPTRRASTSGAPPAENSGGERGNAGVADMRAPSVPPFGEPSPAGPPRQSPLAVGPRRAAPGDPTRLADGQLSAPGSPARIRPAGVSAGLFRSSSSISVSSSPDNTGPAPDHAVLPASPLRPRESPTTSTFEAVGPASAHPWPDLTPPRPFTPTPPSTESVVRGLARARRLAEEQARV